MKPKTAPDCSASNLLTLGSSIALNAFTLWCEQARKPLPVINGGSQQSVYELDFSQKSLESGSKGSNMAVDWQAKRDGAELEQGEAIRAQGAMLRERHTLLQDKDPGFGGLVRGQNKRQELLWVHPDFVGEY